MGRKSSTETLARILVAFWKERTWKQGELAQHCEISTRALRAALISLQEAGIPLESDPEPPHIMWSVPKAWAPTGIALSTEDIQLLVRLLARLPHSPEREHLFEQISQSLSATQVRPRNRTPLKQTDHLAVLEDGLAKTTTVSIDYFTASRGDLAERHVSVHHIHYGDKPSFLATCHRSGALKTFRLSGVKRAQLNPLTPYQHPNPAELQHRLETSVDGYHAGPPVECTFTVRFPEAHWVTQNLPAPMTTERSRNGVRCSAPLAGLEVLARFLVGLGNAASAETPELRKRVHELAGQALLASGDVRSVSKGSVGLNRETG